mmetsp:Transcript_7360/g.16215  ORF Transcript_7360/g.16215 Transcript_7360/m.16215 type:complete len:100 (+) Transcript_7360:1-300(+)
MVSEKVLGMSFCEGTPLHSAARLRAAGLDVPSPGDAENEGDDVDGLANEVDDVGVEDAADQEAAEEAKEEGWWQEGASGEKDRDRAVSSHEVGDLVGAA